MKEQVKKYFDFICKTIDFDIDREIKKVEDTGVRKIRLGLYNMESELVKVNNYIQINKPWFALHILRGLLIELVDKVKNQEADWLIENIQILVDCSANSKSAEQLYQEWLTTEYRTFLDVFKSHNIFTEEELDPQKIGPEFFIGLDDSVQQNLLSSFKYREGTHPVDLFGKSFKLTEQLYITDSIQEFMDYLKRTQPADDFVYVNFLMKIEERIDLSYFLMSFSYLDHVWLVTDMSFDFDNPRNKATTRRPERRREKYYDNVGFPYQLIDQLDEIRKSSKQLVRFDDQQSMELHLMPMKTLLTYNKMFIIAAINHYLEALGSETKKLVTFEDHLNQKLLPGISIEVDEKDATGFEGWDEHIQEVSNDIISEIRSKQQSTALVKVSRDMITSHEMYDRNWLGTSEQLDIIMKWSVFNTQADKMQVELNEIAESKDESMKELNRLLNKPGNFDRLMPYLFSAKKNVWYMIRQGLVGTGFGFEQKPEAHAHCMKYDEGTRWFVQVRIGFDPDEFDQRAKIWSEDSKVRLFNSHDDYLYKPKCKCCGKFKGTDQFFLDVDHYEQLMFLCNVDTKDKLPKYFRAFRSHECIPYHGNSILQNVHPYALLKHPSWKDYSNGLCIKVFLCGNCSRKYKNKYKVAENTLITLDKKVEPYDPGGQVYSVRI